MSAAFLDAAAASRASQSRADLIATAIEVLRVAALSSYENRRDLVRRAGAR